MITENLSTLKIHKLTQAQYERERDAGRIDENALYLTPDEAIDLTSYVTKDYVEQRFAALEKFVLDLATKAYVNDKIENIVDEVDLNAALEEVLV